MEWKTYPEDKPTQSGTTVVGIRVQHAAGVLTTTYTARYDVDNDRWYKSDPFSERQEEQEDITANVLSWIDDLGLHIGPANRL